MRTWPESTSQILAGDFVKRVFLDKDGGGEGMWVRVLTIEPNYIMGTLANDPGGSYVPPLEFGDQVAVNLFEIVDWTRDDPNEKR